MARQADDFLVKRRDDDAKKHPDGEAEFTYFGPIRDQNRFRFLVLRENGDQLSILPGEGRFKKGLSAWRWEEAEGGEPTEYLVVKTRGNRIDLQKKP